MPHVPPPIYALAAGVAQHVLAPEGRAGLPRKIAAAAVSVASGVLAGGAQREFMRRGTTFNPVDPSLATALVTDGPNRLTRNPMYVGLAGLLAAHALARGGWATPLPVIAFVAVIDRLQIPAEEVALRELFGAEYSAYCHSVPRWLGW
jgi:protein-S-isoprenylcysteine O-methyltransferase Ste14